eukprot:GGOE01002848.1.p1 GENE.GGOE01002848.1~~GGOE01002848.1.p1  ORF type:complete len:873 (+),score=187.20 GGOE01002848.1:43-2661(+)
MEDNIDIDIPIDCEGTMSINLSTGTPPHTKRCTEAPTTGTVPTRRSVPPDKRRRIEVPAIGGTSTPNAKLRIAQSITLAQHSHERRLNHMYCTWLHLQHWQQWQCPFSTPALNWMLTSVTEEELTDTFRHQMAMINAPWDEDVLMLLLGTHACNPRILGFLSLSECEKAIFVYSWLRMYSMTVTLQLQVAMSLQQNAAPSSSSTSPVPQPGPRLLTQLLDSRLMGKGDVLGCSSPVQNKKALPARMAAANRIVPMAAQQVGGRASTPVPPPRNTTPSVAATCPPREGEASTALPEPLAVGAVATSISISAVAPAVTPSARAVSSTADTTGDSGSNEPQSREGRSPLRPRPAPRVEMVLQQGPCVHYSEHCCYYCCLGNASACLFAGERLLPGTARLPAPRCPSPPRSWMTAEEQQYMLESQLSPARPHLLPAPSPARARTMPSHSLEGAAKAAEDGDHICRRTRAALRPPAPVVEKTVRMAFICGKIDDYYDMYDPAVIGPEEDCRLQSDVAVARIVAARCPHVDVRICTPKNVSDLRRNYHAELETCDVIHVLESEQFLNGHHYLLYQGFFNLLRLYGDRVVPSLETMSFIMSKVDYLKVLNENNIPHIPTWFVQRPRKKQDWEEIARQIHNWITQKGFTKVVTKPSHSGTRTDLRVWDIPRLIHPESQEQRDGHPGDREQFLQYLYEVFHGKHKPYLLLQPFVPDLAEGEYRLYYFHGVFKACIHTQWVQVTQGEEEVLLRSAPVCDKKVLQACQAVADCVVSLLPQDSVLYRVDLFYNKPSSKWTVNEVEMVDACLLPDFHANQVEELAEAVIRHQPPRPPRQPIPFSVPIVDKHTVADITLTELERWLFPPPQPSHLAALASHTPPSV